MLFSRNKIVHSSAKLQYRRNLSHKEKFDGIGDKFFFELGRDALVWFLSSVSDPMAPEEKTVVLPAIYCSSTSQHLMNAGFKIIWCDVDSTLNLDLTFLSRILQSMKIFAVITCDYFGFRSSSSAVSVLCKKHGVLVGLDKCHSFTNLSLNEPGIDFSFFSFRKTLPVSSGGAVIFKDRLQKGTLENLINSRCKMGRPHFSKTFRLKLDYLIRFICYRQKVLNIYLLKDFFQKFFFRKKILASPIFDVVAGCNPNCPQLHAILSDTTGISEIQKKRRENFLNMYNLMPKKRFKPLFNTVVIDDVPQVFPLLVSKASKLVSYLRQRGVGATTWPGPDFPFEVKARELDFPNANRISSLLVCLPIHQDIEISDLRYIADLIENWR